MDTLGGKGLSILIMMIELKLLNLFRQKCAKLQVQNNVG